MTGYPLLEDMISAHEGLNLKLYLCSAKKWTIGYGRNLQDNGISKEEAVLMRTNDINRCRVEAMSFPWFNSLNIFRQTVILDMLFNLGLSKFSLFRRMIVALQRRDYEKAAMEMLASEWSAQVGKRALELSSMMRLGGLDGITT